jgi:signal transduction histidine kinase
MELIRNWLLPVLMAAAQLALWPGAPLLRGQELDWTAVTAGLVATVLAAVALGWRRRAPVATLGGVVAAVTLGVLATPLDSLAIVSAADVIALFSVAVRRPTGALLLLTGALVVWQSGLNIPVYGTGRGYFGVVILIIAVYLLTAGLGHSRARWLANRRAAARRLAEAEAEQRQAAVAERQRLARELHDVSAHHLTSIVVTATAAQRLAGRRPELATEAREFAARTGRETLAALQRLVAVMRTAEPDAPQPVRARLEELAAGFVRLGQPVTCQLGPTIGDRVGEVVFGIAREALTNALRYAPGAEVRLLVEERDGAVELRVEDDGAGAPANAVPLGSGRGLDGMRERAEAVGGTLDAGPRPDGGWRVRAVLPVGAEPRAVPLRRRWWRRIREQRLVDTAIALAIVVLPLALALVAEEPDGFTITDPATGALIALLVAVHGVPLLWRRHAPWAVLAAIVATSALWPLAAAYAPLTESSKMVLASGGAAEFAAVYAVAAYGRRPWTVWLAVPVAAAGLCTAVLWAAAVDGSVGGEPARLAPLVFVGLFATGFTAVPLAALAGAGLAARHRRDRVLAREQSALTVSTHEALAAARAERRRIAAGLHEAVLHRAARVVAVADRGSLDEVCAEARAALAAMRELLDSLRDTAVPARRGPQSTAAAIDALCGEYRAAGREVTLESPAELPALAADVDVSVFRVVDAALGAGDAAPARVALRPGPRELMVTVDGVPGAVTGNTVAGLQARMAVVGGRLATDPTGTVRVWLPVRPGPAPVEEVAPSPSV